MKNAVTKWFGEDFTNLDFFLQKLYQAFFALIVSADFSSFCVGAHNMLS